MFAIIGIILPIIIGVDFFYAPQTKDDVVTNKYYQVMDNMNQIEYYLYTGSYKFLSDIIFYENTNVSDRITFHYTPIFKTVTSVSRQNNQLVYTCKQQSIYGWPILIVALTFIFSIIVIIKISIMRKSENVEYDSKVNLGIMNAIFCLFTIVATFFHILQ
jgi:hypothetical protein